MNKLINIDEDMEAHFFKHSRLEEEDSAFYSNLHYLLQDLSDNDDEDE